MFHWHNRQSNRRERHSDDVGSVSNLSLILMTVRLYCQRKRSCRGRHRIAVTLGGTPLLAVVEFEAPPLAFKPALFVYGSARSVALLRESHLLLLSRDDRRSLLRGLHQLLILGAHQLRRSPP